ncbi:Rim21p Ecym_3528 [Eremothecium cymbalariae DBVPG|uniref:pH-response regulator protein palH/RIM21 n=1 Tax=Eremothecium cymbalariae (strain CBS 270.75 / DBVPG 7215 / KCTC 17166 / NRRL Y-17582) TaxID=931890 RepID=G8JQM2_ERECY|nr:Hypothetical protein Ecym_3528 [Eremothecium cymbalariae DBVPG\
MVKRTRWRYAPATHNYSGVGGIALGEGILVADFLPNLYSQASSVEFDAFTDMGDPIYSTFMKHLDSAPLLEQVESDWKIYVSSDFDGGPFKYSIYPILYSFMSNLVITVGLTVIVFFNVRKKPYRGVSKLLRVGSLLACVNLIVFILKAMIRLYHHYSDSGVVPMNEVLNMLWTDTAFTSVDLVAVFIFQLCQVQTVMRCFDRVQEKRLVSLCGIILAVVTQVLWAIPPFSEAVSGHFMPLETDGDMDILSPFVYLVRIAQSGIYASLVCLQIFTKRKLCVKGPQIIMLTVLTLFVVLLQPTFFIVDVTNVWIDNLSEIFTTTCYMASTVIVWEWNDRLSVLEGKKQAQSILGRPVYEDEEQGYYFAKYALKVQTAVTRGRTNNAESDHVNEDRRLTGGDDSSSNVLDSSSQTRDEYPPIHIQEGEQPTIVAFNKPQRIWDKAHYILDSIVYYTDKIIVKELGNFTSSLSSKSTADGEEQRHRVRKRVGLDRTNNVYVYKTKDVVFDSASDING